MTHRGQLRACIGVVVLCWFMAARPASALDKLCDPSFENCRTPLLDLINRETQGIDVAFWFMEDADTSTPSSRAGRRVSRSGCSWIPRANSAYPLNPTMLQGFRSAGMSGGSWAHTYDIYFGTSSSPPLHAANRPPIAPYVAL